MVCYNVFVLSLISFQCHAQPNLRGNATSLLQVVAPFKSSALDIPLSSHNCSTCQKMMPFMNYPEIRPFPRVPAVAGVPVGPTSWRVHQPNHSIELYQKFCTTPVQLRNGTNVTAMSIADFYNLYEPRAGKGFVPALADVTLASPEQVSSGNADFYNAFKAEDVQNKIAALTDPDAAEADFVSYWQTAGGAQPYNLMVFTKALALSDLDELLAELEKHGLDSMMKQNLRTKWEPLANASKLIAVNASASSVLGPRNAPNSSQGVHTLGAIVILEKTASTMRPSAVWLQAAGQGGEAQFYTRDMSTGSAWAQALYRAKTAITTLGVWMGHVLHWHMIPEAMYFNLNNTLAPEHPLYVLLKPRMKSNSELIFMLMRTGVMTATATVATTLNDVYELAQAWLSGLPSPSFPEDYEPSHTAADNGLKIKDWPLLTLQQRLWDMAADYAAVVVQEIYDSDAAVKNDVQLAEWIAAAADKKAGNMEALGMRSSLSSKKELRSLLSYLLYTPLTHTLSDLLSNIGNIWNNGVSMPQAVGTSRLPNSTHEYTKEELLADGIDGVLPGGWAYNRLVKFGGATSFGLFPQTERLIPSLTDLSANLTFGNLLPLNDPINQGEIKLRREMLGIVDDFLEKWNAGFCAAYDSHGMVGKNGNCRDWQIKQLSISSDW
jgi:hypothetical protein